MKVGLIGFGRLGKLLTKYLTEDCDLYVYDKILCSKEVKHLGAIPASLEEVCKLPIIIPAVPISLFEEVIQNISSLVDPHSLIVDVCSVKQHPVDVMEKYLPKSVSILGTHPMFGPDSAADTLFGTKIVLCKVRMRDKLYSDIVIYLEKHGIKVIESTPSEHDEQISSSLFLTHLIGRTLIEFDAKKLLIDTMGYRRLRKILLTVENDTWQLFEDMEKYNSYAKCTMDNFKRSLEKTIEHIEG
ncbi:MAG: prephenate dehydrogenase/arogenate dehydrogenase family protein [Bacteriovoracaceae bacterium]|nr:prephenate dehydrogenase/arogenate dehydrogenase family protein [Bacteriovoracaceae bacterium]